MLAAGLHAHVAHPTMAKSMRLRSLRPKVRREAYVLAYADGFYLVGISMLLSLGVVAILRNRKRTVVSKLTDRFHPCAR